MTDKTCKRCNNTKPNDCFGCDKHSSDMLKSWCKECFSIYQKERRKKTNEVKPTPEIITHKTCSKCKEDKDVSMFGGSLQSRDKFKPWRRSCFAEYMKEYKKRPNSVNDL